MDVFFSQHKCLGDPGRINIDNYKEVIIKIGIGKLPEALKKGHQFYSANIGEYHTNSSISESINDYLTDLNTYADKLPSKNQKEIFEKDNGYSGHKWTGSKYKYTKDLKTSEIAKLIKKELDIQFEGEAKFSVTSDVYTGGSSINVKIYDVTINPYEDHFLKAIQKGETIEEYNLANKDHHNSYIERFNKEFKALIKKVETISNQYNFDDSDSQSDYFHVNYYNHVGFDESAYLQKHFPESRDAKRNKEWNDHWDKSKTASKQKADAKKGKFKKGSIVFFKAQMHPSWHKYKLPNGMYLAKITKSPNGRAFYSNYSIQILEDIKVLGEKTLEYHNKQGTNKYYFTNEYGTFYHSSSISANEKDFLTLDDPAAKVIPAEETKPIEPTKEKINESVILKKQVNKQVTKEKTKSTKVQKTAYPTVTLQNYQQQNFNMTEWPAFLKSGHEFITGETEGFKNTDLAEADEAIKQAMNAHLENLNEFLKEKGHHKNSSEIKDKKQTKVTQEGTPVRQVSLALRFIKRYALLNGKTLSLKQLSAFIKTLQKAMFTQQIRATDPHQQTIYHIQDELVNTYNNSDADSKIKFTITNVEKYKTLAKSENEMLSVKLLKKYVGLIGASDKEKQHKLYKEISEAIHSGKITDTDVLKPQLETAIKNLHGAFSQHGKLNVSDAELSGLQGLGFLPTMIAAAVGRGIEHFAHKALTKNNTVSGLGCACQEHKTIEPKKEPQPMQTTPVEIKENNTVMGVNEARALKFDLIGLDGMYLKLIGEACRPTSFFIYGPGGSGKSSFTLLFSNYMAQKGNRVLYVAGEQHGTPVFTKMLERLNIQDSQNFGIVKRIGEHDLKKYDIIAIDSKDSLNYSLEDFIHQREQNPHLTFVILSQGTKAGGFTGTEKWRNEVDSLIYCASLMAYTNQDKNRWGGSAEIDILKLIEKVKRN